MFQLLGFGGRGHSRKNAVRIRRASRASLGFEILEPRDCPAVVYWAAGNKSDGLWSTLKNWTTDRNDLDKVPAAITANDTFVFDNTSTENSTQDILDNVTISAISFQKSYPGTLNVPHALTVSELDMSDKASKAKIAGNGLLRIADDGVWTWKGGTIEVACGTTVGKEALLTISDNGGLVGNAGGLSNHGTVVLEANATLTVEQGSFINQSGSTFKTTGVGGVDLCKINANAVLGGQFHSEAGSTFVLDGDCDMEQSVEVSLGGSIVKSANVGARTLKINGESQLNALAINASAANVRLLGSKGHDLNAVQVQAGSLSVEGTTATLTGTTTVSGFFSQTGTSLLDGDGVLKIAAGGTASIYDGTWEGISVTVAANGKLDFKPSGGGAPFTIKSASMVNNGTIMSERPQDIKFTRSQGVTNFATLTNEATGVINIKSNTQLTAAVAPEDQPTFSNAGTVNVGTAETPGPFTFEVQFPVTNTGTVALTSKSVLKVTGDPGRPERVFDYSQSKGTTTLNDGSTLQASQNVTISGGTLSVPGETATVIGKTVTNGGTVSLGGEKTTLTVTGDYTQGAAGTLKIVVAQGSKSGKVAVSGTATLAGTLEASVQDKVGAGDTYLFMSFNKSGGTFGTFSTQDAKLKNDYELKYNADNAKLIPKAPEAFPDAATTNEDTAVTIDVLANDVDHNGTGLTITNVTQPGHGSASVSNSKIVYTPAADYYGSDGFNYTITDGQGRTATAFVNITVNPINDAPVAVDDSASTTTGTAVYILVLSNDWDVDDLLTVSSYTQPSHGSVSFSSGVATYTPSSGWTGTDSFTYTLSDGHGGTDTATVTVTVTSPPPPPPPSPPPPPGFGSVTGRVWDDADGDGVQDLGEAGFGTSVQVLLLDSNGNTVASTWTVSGVYSFSDIANGQYRIRVILPSGYQFSPPGQGDENNDSDVDSDGYSGFFTIDGNTSFDLDAGVEDV